MQAVEKRDSALVKASLNTFQTLLEDHLSVFTKFIEQIGKKGATPPGDFNMRYKYHFSPPHPWELNLSHLIVRASENNSPDCMDEILNSLYKLVCMCFGRNEQKSFHDLLFEFYRSYQLSSVRPDADTSPTVAAVKHRLPWVASCLGVHLFEHEDSLECLEKVFHFSTHYYSLCLHLLRCSAERSDTGMFNRVIEDLDNFLRDKIPEDVRSLRDDHATYGRCSVIEYGLEDRSAEEQSRFIELWSDLHDYRNLLYVIAGAWLVYQAKENKIEHDNMTPFLGKLTDKVPDMQNLLDLYAMPGMADMFTNHDNPLGFDRWDWSYSPYSQPRFGTDFQRWIQPFYELLILKKAAERAPGRISLKNIRETEGASHGSLMGLLAKIADASYVAPVEWKDATWEMKPEDIDKGKEAIQKLLEFWTSKDSAGHDNTEASK